MKIKNQVEGKEKLERQLTDLAVNGTIRSCGRFFTRVSDMSEEVFVFPEGEVFVVLGKEKWAGGSVFIIKVSASRTGLDTCSRYSFPDEEKDPRKRDVYMRVAATIA